MYFRRRHFIENMVAQKENELDRSRILMSNMSKGSHLRAKRIYRSPHAADISFRKSEAVLARHRRRYIRVYVYGRLSQISRSIFPRGRIFRNKTVSVSKLSESRTIGIFEDKVPRREWTQFSF